jgi:archaellin
MNLDVLIGLLAVAAGVLMTLAFQAHQKAAKAVREAKEAVASVDSLSDIVRYQVKVINDQTKAHVDVFTSDYDKRIQKLEIRVDDVANRLAAQQIKR